MSEPSVKVPPSREKRLDTLSAYFGETTALLHEFQGGEVDQRIRTFSQSAPDDLSVTLEVLAGIGDAITIIHGPQGCAASRLRSALSQPTGRDGEQRWMVTNLNQRETILGADGKLRAAVAAFYRRYGPKVVFIVATPAVAINNDDILSVVDELSEELGTVIVPIFASGFASKSAVQGHDLAMHGLVKYLTAKQPEQRGDHINLLSTTESTEDRQEAKRLLAALGLEAQTLPAGNGVGVFHRAAGAKLSVPLNFDVSSYLGEALQSVAGVPFLSVPRPIGLSAIKHWLLGVGAATGREAQARELHAREAAALAGLLEAAPLRGVRVYLSLEPATALGMLDLVQELGGEIAGLTVEHLDRLHIEALRSFQHRAPALQIHIANGQGFEELNLLQRIKPDLYVGGGGHLAQVAHLGIPSVFLPRVPILGYRGVTSFTRQARKALRNRAFVTQLATQLTTSGLPYLAPWFQRSPNWHIKQEVK